ncbi:YhfH family protein [Bacillus sp. ISL-40]|nr:YhfH family protein [Bacillus sp. ISL-40]MBT2722359.1 YhfH family protein [Bacillus sp. ISL-46]MBT2743362.1 YhfH family protein [Bacillus sp. ISL-77]
MLIKMTEFFKNLPSKTCTNCGKKIEEQYESYVNTCDNCSKSFTFEMVSKKEDSVFSVECLNSKRMKCTMSCFHKQEREAKASASCHMKNEYRVH